MVSAYKVLDRATWLVWLPMCLAFTAAAVVATVRGPVELAAVAWLTWAAVAYIVFRRVQQRIAAARSIVAYLFGTMPLRLHGACELRWTAHHQAWLVSKLLLWQERHVAWARANRLNVDAVLKAYDRASLSFVDRPFMVEGRDGLQAGVCDGGRIIVAWLAGQTLDETALQHEVSHLLQAAARGRVDEVLEHNTFEGELRERAA